MDLPAILARKPEVVIVDELAHTNVPGAENDKRYEDVEDLLEAGISVMTAVNIQHFESVQDIVSRVTGVDVQERVPDRLLRQADALVNVDLPSEELRERLKAGKIYPAERIGPALRELLHRGEPRVAARARDAPDRRPARGRAPRPARDRRRPSPSARRPWSRCRRTPRRRACCCAGRRRSPASSTRTGSPSTSARRGTARSGCRPASTASSPRTSRSPWSSAPRSSGSPPSTSPDELLRFAREHGITLAIFGKTRRPWWLGVFRSEPDRGLRRRRDRNRRLRDRDGGPLRAVPA